MSKKEVLYQKIENAITEGSLRTGERLPPERVLAEKYGLSRSSVREVLQRLKEKGWLTSKQGGGHYVSQNLQQELAEPIKKILKHAPDAHFDLLEFRRSIEADCAYFAALRANDLDLQAVERAFTRLRDAYSKHDLEIEAEADAQFHLSLAEASHNLIYLHLTKSMFDILRGNMRSSIDQMFQNNITRESLMRQHAAIFDAVINHKPTTAREAALEHINYVQQTLQDLEKEKYRQERSQRRYDPL